MTRNDVEISELTNIRLTYPNSIFSDNNTYSTLFLLPALDIPLRDNLCGRYVNAYIDDIGLAHDYPRPVFVLTKYPTLTDETTRSVDLQLRANVNFIYDYIAGTTNGSYLVMYVYNFPKEYANDYDRFLAGQYSKFSDTYKEKFHRRVPNAKGQMVESPVWGVLQKTAILKRKIEQFLSHADDGTPVEPVCLDPKSEYFGRYEDRFEIFRYQ